MIGRIVLTVLACGCLFASSGCKHKCCRSDGLAPAPFLPSGPNNIPPAGVPVTPIGGSSLPEPDFGPGGPARPSPAPAAPGRDTLFPDPLPGGRNQSFSPADKNSFLGSPVAPRQVQSPEPPVATPPKNVPATTTSAELPGFQQVKEGVANGGKPTLEGFDLLKSRGYRTIAYLHPTGTDISAIRDLAEKRGMTFRAIETTPENLTSSSSTFNKLVLDRNASPVYIFDDTGVLVGSLWYMHFRTIDVQSAEVAKIRAHSLGLKDEGEEAKSFWVAIQKIISTSSN